MSVIEQFEPWLDTMLDAVVVMQPDGRISAWNRAATLTFGHGPDEAVGQMLGELIVPPAMRDAHRDGLARVNEGGDPHVLDKLLELSAIHQDGHEFPCELSITRISDGDEWAYIGFLRDISVRVERDRDRERQLAQTRRLLEVALQASGDTSVDDITRMALEAVVDLTGWELGHSYLVTADGQGLDGHVWAGDVETHAEFVKRSEDFHFPAGVGAPGKALATSLPQFVSDTDEDEEFLRRGLGFRAAFAFPVKADDRTAAIIEFLSLQPSQSDPQLFELARIFGAQIGRVIERDKHQRRQQLLVGELQHRTRNLLSIANAIAHQSLRGIPDIDDRLASLGARLEQLGRANRLLAGQDVGQGQLDQLVRNALDGCGADPARYKVEGDPIELSASVGTMMALAIHELGTNAHKYGAFSNGKGRVCIRWSRNGDGFDFEWREVDGPEVHPPRTTGFGSNIFVRGIEGETGGTVTLEYAPSGLIYRLEGARPGRKRDEERGTPSRTP